MLYARRVLLFVAGIGALGACGGYVDAPEPARDEDPAVQAPPRLPPGIIAAPLTLDLASALAALEAEVPRQFGTLTRRQRVGPRSRSSYAFFAERGPFSVGFAGDTVVLAATIRYRGRGWYDPPVGPTVTGSCGLSGASPRARLVLRVAAELTADWRLRTRTRLARMEPLTTQERDQCEISFLKLDVTGDVLKAAEGALRKALPVVDGQLALIDVRTPLEALWRELLDPIRVSDSVWLVLNPEGVSMGRLSGDREKVVAPIAIAARPGFVTGAKPVVASSGLPPLGQVVGWEGFAVQVEGRFDYPSVSDILTGKLRGVRLRAPGGTMVIRGVDVVGLGGGRVGMGVRFRGTAGGRVWLVGSPVYDTASRMIAVPDLDFHVSSAGLLVRGLAWLKADEIRTFLRREAWLPVDGLLRELEAVAEKETNRELARGVRLGADITGAEPIAIHATREGILLRARAVGTARLSLGPELFRKPQAAGTAVSDSAAESADSGGLAAPASGSRRSPPAA
ncbi:MAG: DUF4403 family protein [Gemmatimonadales bacterium]